MRLLPLLALALLLSGCASPRQAPAGASAAPTAAAPMVGNETWWLSSDGTGGHSRLTRDMPKDSCAMGVETQNPGTFESEPYVADNASIGFPAGTPGLVTLVASSVHPAYGDVDVQLLADGILVAESRGGQGYVNGPVPGVRDTVAQSALTLLAPVHPGATLALRFSVGGSAALWTCEGPSWPSRVELDTPAAVAGSAD